MVKNMKGIGKMGKSYTIDAKIFSVETGETVLTKNATHKGYISGLLTEMEIMAWEIIGLQAPQRLKLKRAGSEATKTVAVLDFEGRGITLQEAQTLTDRFATALRQLKKERYIEQDGNSGIYREVSESRRDAYSITDLGKSFVDNYKLFIGYRHCYLARRNDEARIPEPIPEEELPRELRSRSSGQRAS